MIVSANEVKKRGVSLFGELLEKWDEVIINFRGEKKYVVMDVERYKELRALELDHAYTEVMEDIKNGDYHTDVVKHLKEIADV
ncbi:prevent-host-death protein [Sulfurimonas sediminis]|uniref:Prevent-host-death protein n=1 Tax=Sulfurimonas sediminis TaxID=2590020 RepID=A0A7M1B4G9_9BACT|nr:prevent-host-death protein [Sulfurimonas sediminis]QOP44545.1 prevent-host-death protein [Sulfurimonas sediminis]